MRPPACCATWELPSPSEKCGRARVLPWRPMRNITHQLLASGQVALVRWLGRSAQSAVGLVRGDRVSLTNVLFRALDQRNGEWRWSCGGHAALRYASLRHLACEEAGDLLRTGDASRTCRFERVDCALEVRLERLPTATGPAVMVLGHDVSEQV